MDLRDDIALFSAKVLRQPLWPHQEEAAKSTTFITDIAAARRTGKSSLAETLSIHTTFRERDVKALVLSATQEASRRLTESIAATLNGHDLTRGAVVDDFSTRVRLSNGSEVISLPASQRQVRGFGKGVKLVILDEAGFMPSELWAAAHYVALDEKANGARIFILGTPWGNNFHREHYLRGQDGDPDVSSFHWTFKANPNLDHGYLERQRERVSPAEYHAEVLGEWSDAIGSLFPRELLERQTADIEVPMLHQLHPSARGICGIDWGFSFDQSAAVAVFRLPVQDLNAHDEWRPRFVALPYVWPAGAPLISTVVRELVAAADAFQAIAPETNGVGAAPAQELVRLVRARDDRIGRRWNAVATTNASKTAGYGCVLALLEQDQLILPRHPDLLRQLAGLKFEHGERGFTKIEGEDRAVHDDVADALMLAALPYKPARGKRIVCDLLNLARARTAVPDARVPELDCALVETGGGLRLYQQPPLQSVRSDDLTLNAAAVPTDLPARRGQFLIYKKGGQ